MESREPTKPYFPPMPPMTEAEIAQAEQENQRRYGGISRRSVLELVVLLVLLAGYCWGWYYGTRLPFDAARWKTAEIDVRGKMCDNLIGSNKLMGLNHSQVVALLGKPDEYRVRKTVMLPSSAETDSGEWNIGYTVRTGLLDTSMLLLRFGPDKRVSECEVFTFN